MSEKRRSALDQCALALEGCQDQIAAVIQYGQCRQRQCLYTVGRSLHPPRFGTRPPRGSEKVVGRQGSVFSHKIVTQLLWVDTDAVNAQKQIKRIKTVLRLGLLLLADALHASASTSLPHNRDGWRPLAAKPFVEIHPRR